MLYTKATSKFNAILKDFSSVNCEQDFVFRIIDDENIEYSLSR